MRHNSRTTVNCLRAALILPMLMLAGCASNMIRVEAIDPLIQIVADRHDDYVENDSSLELGKKEAYLRSTELLRRLMEEAKK
jgi:hypothetical protein